jgi:hypothetical protein
MNILIERKKIRKRIRYKVSNDYREFIDKLMDICEK